MERSLFDSRQSLAPGCATGLRDFAHAQGYFHDMEATPRLKAGIFVRALTRRTEVAGASAFVVRMGSEEAGAIILRINRLDGSVLVLNQARNAKGELVWAQPLAGWTDEKRATEWCDKQVKFDPDLWIVEIEDREGRTFVDEPVV